MLALANSVGLLVLSRSDRHVLGLLLCAGVIALCCAVRCGAVLAVSYILLLQYRYKKKADKNKNKTKNEKRRLFKYIAVKCSTTCWLSPTLLAYAVAL